MSIKDKHKSLNTRFGEIEESRNKNITTTKATTRSQFLEKAKGHIQKATEATKA